MSQLFQVLSLLWLTFIPVNFLILQVREGTLQIIMTVSRIFPSTEIDVPKCVRVIVRRLNDKKRRVRQAALETLAALTQLSSTSIVLDFLANVIDEYTDRDQIMRVIRSR